MPGRPEVRFASIVKGLRKWTAPKIRDFLMPGHTVPAYPAMKALTTEMIRVDGQRANRVLS
eukprot:6561404-Prymnesium_polylepis.1